MQIANGGWRIVNPISDLRLLISGSCALLFALCFFTVLLFPPCSVLLVPCFLAQAQQPKNIPVIGFLSATSGSAIAGRVEAFQRGLRELGYVEGKNIVV